MHIELTLDKSIVINTRRNCGFKHFQPFIIPLLNLNECDIKIFAALTELDLCQTQLKFPVICMTYSPFSYSLWVWEMGETMRIVYSGGCCHCMD